MPLRRTSGVMEPPAADRRAARAAFAGAALLIGFVVALLAPHLFQGRSLLPLELIPLFQPWARHARELWGEIPPVHNPLLDALQQYYPRRVYLAEALRGGWWPLWNPNVYGGTPFLAAQQGAVLYPPGWLLLLLPPALQFGWSAAFHLALAALGSFALFRALRLHPAAAAAGAAAFALNGFVVVWLAYPNVTQWTFCWLPLALFLWERTRERGSGRALVGCAAALGLAVLGGHAQSSAYVLLTWLAWALFRLRAEMPPASRRARVREALVRIGAPLALALGLALAHWLPAVDYVPRTDRGAPVPWSAVVAAGMPPAQFWTFLLPRLFGDETRAFAYQFWLPAGDRARLAFVERSFYPGVAVLVLAAGGIAAGIAGGTAERRSGLRALALFSSGLAAAAILMAMGTPLYWPLWKALPGFRSFTAVARIVGMAAWPIACLAAIGLDRAVAADAAARRRALRGIALGAVLGGGATLVGHFIYGGAAPPEVTEALAAQGGPSVQQLANRDAVRALALLLAPAVLLVLVRPRRAETPGDPASPARLPGPDFAAWLCVAIVGADLIAFGAPFQPASDPRLLGRETPEIAHVRRLLQERPQAPFRFLSAGPRGREMDIRQRMPSNLPSVFGFADIAGSDSFVPLRYRRWEAATAAAAGGGSPWARPGAPNLRAAGVRVYLTGSRQPFPGLRPAVGTAVQEDDAALPYARLHENAQAVPGPAALRAALAHPAREPRVALLLGPNAPSFQGPARVTPFRVRRINGNRLILEGESARPGLLLVCEQFDPGWRATVDGRPARLLPADELWLGIPLPARPDGPHRRVELVYAPESFRVGAFGTLLALAALTAVWTASGGRRRRVGGEERA